MAVTTEAVQSAGCLAATVALVVEGEAVTAPGEIGAGGSVDFMANALNSSDCQGLAESRLPARGDTIDERTEQKGSAIPMITKAAEEMNDPEVESMPELAETTVKELVSIFKLLSDETRLRILFYLTQRDELHVRALCSLLGQSQPAVSHHLALLRVAGLIEPRRSGKHNFYRILPQRFQDLLDTLFGSVPATDRRLRFENYVLSYAPVADVI
jgi:ArsR family transcriptional regulator, arsenate/arsenite/antimonite-responsive transcriptional repressor